MRVIDLLNKIANGDIDDLPDAIKYKGNVYGYDGLNQNYVRRINFTMDFLIGEDITAMLNDELEVIGEKLKPLEDLNLTKIDITKEGQVYGVTKKEIILDIQTIQHWINKTIDAINKMREDKR